MRRKFVLTRPSLASNQFRQTLVVDSTLRKPFGEFFLSVAKCWCLLLTRPKGVFGWYSAVHAMKRVCMHDFPCNDSFQTKELPILLPLINSSAGPAMLPL